MNDELRDARLVRRSRKAYAETKPFNDVPQEPDLSALAMAHDLIRLQAESIQNLTHQLTMYRRQLEQKDNIIAGQSAIIHRAESELAAWKAKVSEITRAREGSD